MVSTFATGFNLPWDIKSDSADNLYVSQTAGVGSQILKITPDAVVLTIAGQVHLVDLAIDPVSGQIISGHEYGDHASLFILNPDGTDLETDLRIPSETASIAYLGPSTIAILHNGVITRAKVPTLSP